MLTHCFTVKKNSCQTALPGQLLTQLHKRSSHRGYIAVVPFPSELHAYKGKSGNPRKVQSKGSLYVFLGRHAKSRVIPRHIPSGKGTLCS